MTRIAPSCHLPSPGAPDPADAQRGSRISADAGILAPEPDLEALSTAELDAMLGAAHEVHACQRALADGGLTVLTELRRGRAEFRAREPYPTHGVFDRVSCARYYYHVHDGLAGEHGHFHTLLRTDCAAPGETAADGGGPCARPASEPHFAHLIAVSLDAAGRPIGLFAPNQWDAGGDWRPAPALAELVPCFRIAHAYPSWAVNRWLSALFVLLRAHIRAVLSARDATAARWARLWPADPVLERRDLAHAAWMPVDVAAAAASARSALERRRRHRVDAGR